MESGATANPNWFEQHFDREQSVFLDKNAISPHFVPKHLPFREKEQTELSEQLSAALYDKKPSNVFIYGKPGAGKTAVSRSVLSQLLLFAQTKNKNVNGAYINCRHHNSKYRVLSKVVKELFPNENFLGYSASFVFDKTLEGVSKRGLHYVLILDEIDKVKDLDELVYALSRSNDELSAGSVSLVGISNNVLFKDRLDSRTKSSLCEHEMVFAPYNAAELSQILLERIPLAFKSDTVETGAVRLAAALSASESGDCRQAVLLLQKAGELADQKKSPKVTENEVHAAKKKVEEEIVLHLISTLPRHQQFVLHALATLSLQKKSQQRIAGSPEEAPLFSGEVFDEYVRTARQFKEPPVSSRWYRQYVSELETLGMMVSTASGHGFRGNSRFLRLSFEPKKIVQAIEKEFLSQSG